MKDRGGWDKKCVTSILSKAHRISSDGVLFIVHQIAWKEYTRKILFPTRPFESETHESRADIFPIIF